MKKYTLISLILFGLSFISQAQTYEIDAVNGQTISTCSGIFYDSGGPSGSYSSGESYTVTFCPSTPNTYIQLVFTDWNLGTGGSLQVYDGPSTSSNSFGTFSAGGFSPMTMDVIASPTNSSGCLTLVWTSGSSGQGWEAYVNCAIPCQNIQANLFSSNPLISSDGFIDICQGETITLSGGGLFPENNLVYGQSNSTSTFVWDYGDGTVDTTSASTVNYTYVSVGGYNVNLTVIDSMGCTSSNVLDARVRISTTPIFNGTMPEDSVICQGEEVTLLGVVDPTPFEVTADLALAGQTFLPDGSGASYSTSLVFDAFAPGQTVTNVSDIISICAVMEHSYLGDLDIWLECPNGSIVNFVVYPNGCGSTYLGVPIDIDSNLNPGTGYQYCWSPSATNGTFSAECGSYSTLPAGTYSAVDSWTNFIGCPLNGAWTIGITDNLLSDNGYIFEWGLTFDPNILPSNFNYEPEILDYEWTNTFGVYVSDSASNTVIAPEQGLYNYTFTVVDDFGCEYDTIVELEVLPSYHVYFPEDTVLCSDESIVLDATDNGANVGANYEWHWDATAPAIISTAGGYTITKPGFYWVDIPNIVEQCGFTDSIYVEYNELELDLGNDISDVCQSNLVTLDATTASSLTQGTPSYSWSNLAVSPTITAFSSGTYTVSVTRGNCTEIDEITVTYDQPILIDLEDELFLCEGSSVVIDPGLPGEDFQWNTGTSGETLEITIPATYMVTVSNSCGNDIDTFEVIGYSIPVIDLGPDLLSCEGTGVAIDGSYNGVGPQPSYLWSTGQTLPIIMGTTQGFYSVTTTNDCGSFSDQLYLTIEQPLNVNLGADTTLCEGDSIILYAGVNAAYYYWSTGSSADSLLVNSGGNYSLEVDNTCGTFSDEININYSIFNFSLGADTAICPNSSLILEPAIPQVQYYYWSDGSSNSSFTVSAPGTYYLTATNIYNCEFEDEITISELVTVLDLGEDTSICEGDEITITSNIIGFENQWSTGAQGDAILVDQAGTYSLSIDHPCSVSALYDEIIVSVNPEPIVDFGSDTIFILSTESATLDAGNSGATYAWSNGETTQTIIVGEGSYSVTVSLNGCEGYGEVVVFVNNSLPELSLNEQITLYPNPTSQFVYIESVDRIIDSYTVYNSIGQSLIHKESGNMREKVNLEHLSKGIYFVKVMVKDDFILLPIVKE